MAKHWIKLTLLGMFAIATPAVAYHLFEFVPSSIASEQPQKLERLDYNQFIEEVELGNIERVSISADRSYALLTFKNQVNRKLVYLVDDPSLIDFLTRNNVDISVLPQMDNQPSQQLERWRYSQLIQEVEKVNVDQVRISADRSTALVTLKGTPDQKLVYLVNDPDFIEILARNNVNIIVLPPDSF